MRRSLKLAGAALLALATAAAAQTAGSGFIWERLEKAFAARDLDAYADLFDPGLRARERRLAESILQNWKMEKAIFRPSGEFQDAAGVKRVFVQVLYQNEFAAMLETWQVRLAEDGGAWRIIEKETAAGLSSLYKLRIPSGRVERAAAIEVRHKDIVLTFRDAFVFYDNIPGLETALVVIGDGRVRFDPSSDTERRQLMLRFKKPYLEDRLESAYLRFSPSFFSSNIKIEGASAAPGGSAVLEASNRAFALFGQNYGASFATDSPLTPDLLSFLPQGDQAVFDLRAVKAGDLSYVYSPFSEEEIHLLGRRPDRVINLYSPDEAGPNERRMFVSMGRQVDVLGYRIEVDFQPEKFYFSARARIEASAEMGDVESLKFLLNARLDVLKILDREGRELFYTRDRHRDLLYVYLPKPLPRGQTAEIEVFYRGSLPPQVQVADVVRRPQYTNTISLIGPKYETYLYSVAEHWYPAPTEDDFFQARLRFIVPPQYQCIGNGRPTGTGRIEADGGVMALDKVGYSTFGFETTSPVKYLSFIAGVFSRVGNGNGAAAVPVKAYASADLRQARRTLADETKAVLAVFEKAFGPFPFAKLDVIQRLWPSAGGHSPASFVVLNELPRSPDEFRVADPNSPVDLSRWKEAFLAHEIGHQWWGQSVTWASYRDQWLSEGLAHFSALLFVRERYGAADYLAGLAKLARWTAKKSKFGPITLGSRLLFVDADAYQALVYDKAALVLSMLMDLLGEETFFRGLREFFEASKFKAARTAGFRAALEKASARDLKSFFALWFDSSDLPQVHATHAVQPAGRAAVLKFRIRQIGPAFRFPLWVGWEESKQKVRRMLEISAADQEFEFPCAAAPSRIKIDPDGVFPGGIN